MIKKTIKYKDFNDEEVEEEFYFHLTKAELIEFEVKHEGGLEATMKRIMTAKNNYAILDEFKQLILLAYGQRSDDGRHFIKTQALREQFESSEAYSEMFMELLTAPDAASAIEFFNGIMPKGLAEDAAKMGIDPPKVPTLEVVSEPIKITRRELIEMDHAKYTTVSAGLAEGKYILVEDSQENLTV